MTIPNDQEAIKPLPCPFCGGNDIREGIHQYHGKMFCFDCDAVGPASTPMFGFNNDVSIFAQYETTLQAWNRRA